jgi:3-dehydroquinate dehydratase
MVIAVIYLYRDVTKREKEYRDVLNKRNEQQKETIENLLEVTQTNIEELKKIIDKTQEIIEKTQEIIVGNTRAYEEFAAALRRLRKGRKNENDESGGR